MNALELRVGNYLYDRKKKLCKVERIEPSDYNRAAFQFDAPVIGEALTHLPYEPIPLTEEVLKRLGFMYDKETCTWSYTISLERFDYVFELEHINDEVFITIHNIEWNYKYVHQLQNLFFGLTGFELKLNFKN